MTHASSAFVARASFGPAPAVLTRAAFSPSGAQLAVPDQTGKVSILNYPSLSRRDEFTASAKPLWISCWSPDGTSLAVGGRDNTVRVFDLARRAETITLRGHSDDVHAVGWSPDGATVFSASYDGTVRLWQAADGAALRTVPAHHARIEDAFWGADGQLVTAARDGHVRIWDPATADLRADIAAHRGFVLRVLPARHSPTLFSASSDGTVRVWDGRDHALLHVIEGFEATPHDLSLSHDEQLLAVKDDGHAVRFYRTDTFQLIDVVDESADHHHWYGTVRFHPSEDGLVTTGDGDRRLTAWSYDPALIRRVTAETSAPRYANCRIGVLGNTGVGKTALAAALRGEQFQPTESTHGTRASLLSRVVVDDDGGEVVREVFLWDFAGQPIYRLMQRLDVEDMAIALLVLDNRNTTDPREEIREWETLLRTAQATPYGAPARIVVVARVDRGSVQKPLPSQALGQEIERLLGVVETSAKDGTNIDTLRTMILDNIAWDRVPVITSDAGFQRLRMFVLQSVSQGTILERIHTFHAQYVRHCSRLGAAEPSLEQFRSLLSFLDVEGLVRRLSFGNLVLLDPALLRSYASMLLVAAQRCPAGDGTLNEDDVLAQRVPLPVTDRVDDRERERDLLHAALQEFLAAGVVIRESSGAALRFPSAVRRLPDESAWQGLARGIVYRLTALADYAHGALVVALHASGIFTDYELWTMTACFTRPNGHRSWIRTDHDGAGRIRVDVRHGREVTEVELAVFHELCLANLLHFAVGGAVTREVTVVCGTCATVVSPDQVRRRRERGLSWMTCGVCDGRIELPGEPAEPALMTRAAQSTVVSRTDDIEHRAAAERVVSLRSAEVQLKEKRDLYDVFVSYSHQDEQAVVDLVRRLRARGIRPWLDIWELVPGQQWLGSLQEQVDSIPSAIVVLGPSGIGPWQRQEMWYVLQQFLARGCPVIPVLLEGTTETQLPSLLGNMQWVDFRRSSPDPMDHVIWGITGIRPEGGDL
ncbi:hypothetical protein GCM10023322_06310 [Rugosimonospora acidiphila]|uniref:TIR domain-containing protein n=1 Tax=Rugosimonospora acidiphila TaxID=556531 RepID=A0ABP9RJ14_9ACTN